MIQNKSRWPIEQRRLHLERRDRSCCSSLSLRIFRWGRVVVVEFLFALRLGKEEEEEEEEENRTLGRKTRRGRRTMGEGEDVSGYYASVFAVTSRTRLTPEKPHIYIYIYIHSFSFSLSFFLCIAPSSSSSSSSSCLNTKFKDNSPPKTVRTLFCFFFFRRRIKKFYLS